MDMVLKESDPLFPYGMIQVAGVHDLEEAALLLDHGVDLIGIPLRLPVNAEDLTEEDAKLFCQAYPGKCCLITYLSDSKEIIEFVDSFDAQVVQLHGEVEKDSLKQVKAALPDLHIIKSLVIGRFPVHVLEQYVEEYSPYVSAFITDTFNPETGAEGATGLTHDWHISRRLRIASNHPLILAGGLNAGNVVEAIEFVQPWGVDVHTGVENADGRKSAGSVAPFVQAARLAFSRIKSE
jgi:phosphoribosylanthranilate isomerase